MNPIIRFLNFKNHTDNFRYIMVFFSNHADQPLAEKVGFEPTVPCGITGFQDQLFKPLRHLSE